MTLKRQYDEMVKRDQEIAKLQETIRVVTERASSFKEEKDFLLNRYNESKRENKLLKLALSKLQNEFDVRFS